MPWGFQISKQAMSRSNGSLRSPYGHRKDQNRTFPHGLHKALQGLSTIITAARAPWITRSIDRMHK